MTTVSDELNIECDKEDASTAAVPGNITDKGKVVCASEIDENSEEVGEPQKTLQASLTTPKVSSNEVQDPSIESNSEHSGEVKFTKLNETESKEDALEKDSIEDLNKENGPEDPAKAKPGKSTDAKEEGLASLANSSEKPASDDQAQHITYDEDGTAVYTDPNTKHKYRWCEKSNNWLAKDTSTEASESNYENEHYKWCTVSQRWILKNEQTTETEFYKWDAEKNEWVPKANVTNSKNASSSQKDEKVYGIDENGDRIYTDKDGVVFIWDEEKSAWFPKIDDDFMARYQMNYGFIDNVSAGEEEKRKKDASEAERKAAELEKMAEEAREAMKNEVTTNVGGKRKPQEPPKWFDIDQEHNTKVYVSNLPLDITLDEFAELMGKCGMIMRDPQTQKFKLKLYTEADGQIKGDGLCDYIKVESVDLALNILDEYVYRGNKIRVQRAQFQMRGEYNPALKPKRKKKDKEKLNKIKERLFDWRPDKMRGERSKNEKVVIIKNLFTPDIFEKDIQLILDYQNDLREECSKCGTVRKVIIYDLHPEGVAQINMASPEEADLVIQMMQGRFFGKRQLSAEHWDGKTKFKIGESEKETQERLTNWDEFLEKGEGENCAQMTKQTAE